MPLEVLSTPYGRLLERLRAAIADAKDGDPLAPVGVVVPSNHVGVTARRAWRPVASAAWARDSGAWRR